MSRNFKAEDLGPETITLVGGPADGERYTWKGGDIIKVTGLPRAPNILDGPPPKRPLAPVEFTYRRSLNDRTRFVYQP